MGRPAKEHKNLPPSTQRFLDVIKEKGLSRSDLAQRFGMSIDGINKIFSRGSEITVVQAKAIELDFGIRQQWILNGDGPKKKNLNINKLEQLLLRLTPNYSPELTWQCFEELLDNDWFGRQRLGWDPTGFEYKKYSTSLMKFTGNSEWLDKFNSLQHVFAEKVQEIKSVYIDIANQSSVGGHDQTLVLKILLDGVELTDEMLSEEKMLYSKQLLTADRVEMHLRNLKKFSELRRQINDMMEPPLELKKEYVKKINKIRSKEEMSPINARRSGELLVRIQPFLKINAQEKVVEDRIRQQIFHQKTSIATNENIKIRAQPKKVEQINLELIKMQEALRHLLKQWKQEGGDGTAS